MHIELNEMISAGELADLRQAVGWNRMEKDLADPARKAFFHLSCRHDKKLIGYLEVISNGVTDAYIQDLMIHPDYQRQGLGKRLLDEAMRRLRAEGVYMVSVIYGDPSLQHFYEEMGFMTMLCGQIELRPERI